MYVFTRKCCHVFVASTWLIVWRCSEEDGDEGMGKKSKARMLGSSGQVTVTVQGLMLGLGRVPFYFYDHVRTCLT